MYLNARLCMIGFDGVYSLFVCIVWCLYLRVCTIYHHIFCVTKCNNKALIGKQ